MEFIKGKQPTAGKIIIYGPPGIGKSTLASLAPSPVFIDLEGGLNQIECDRTPKIETWDGLLEATADCVKSNYKTIVIDTISACEQILETKALADFNESVDTGKQKTCLSEIGWQAGYQSLKATWSLYLKMLSRAQEEYHKHIVLVGHSVIAKFEDPTTESYDRYVIDTHKLCHSVLVNNVDAVLFCQHGMVVRDKENSSKKIAKSTGERVVFTHEKPGFVAKNRFALADKITMHPDIYKAMGWL